MPIPSRYRLKAALASEGWPNLTAWITSKQGAHPCTVKTAIALLHDAKRARKDRSGVAVRWLIGKLCEDSGLSYREVESAIFGEELDGH